MNRPSWKLEGTYSVLNNRASNQLWLMSLLKHRCMSRHIPQHFHFFASMCYSSCFKPAPAVEESRRNRELDIETRKLCLTSPTVQLVLRKSSDLCNFERTRPSPVMLVGVRVRRDCAGMSARPTYSVLRTSSPNRS